MVPVDVWIVPIQPGKTSDDWVCRGSGNVKGEEFFMVTHAETDRNCWVCDRTRRDRVTIDDFNFEQGGEFPERYRMLCGKGQIEKACGGARVNEGIQIEETG